MTSAQLQAMAISAAILYAAYKYGPSVVSGGAVAVAAVLVAKKLPYLQDQLAA
jgi:hypothetical protein